MKKSSLYNLLSYIAVIGIFNLIFWLIGPNMTTARWISYALIHVSFTAIIVSPYITKNHPDGHVGGMLLQNISRMYFIFEFLIGIILLCIPSDGEIWLKIVIGVQGVLLLVYLICVFFVMFSSHSYSEAQAKHEANKTAKLSLGTLRRIYALCADDELKENIQVLIDKASTTPVTVGVASEFEASAAKLERAVRTKDKAKSIEGINELLAILG